MSALYGSMNGERGEVTKCGHKALSAHVRGWDSGVSIEARHGESGDTFSLYVTGGSNASANSRFIGEVKGGEFIPAIRLAADAKQATA